MCLYKCYCAIGALESFWIERYITCMLCNKLSVAVLLPFFHSLVFLPPSSTLPPHAFPFAMQVLAIISFLTLVVLAFASELKQAGTIQRVMQRFAGAWGGVITDMVVFLYSLATCIVFLVIIGDQLEDCEWKALLLPFTHSVVG